MVLKRELKGGELSVGGKQGNRCISCLWVFVEKHILSP